MTAFRDAYHEFTGKTVEEALRAARDEFGAGLDELDFEILTPGSRGVLGMGAEPARVLAAPRSALGGSVNLHAEGAIRRLYLKLIVLLCDECCYTQEKQSKEAACCISHRPDNVPSVATDSYSSHNDLRSGWLSFHRTNDLSEHIHEIPPPCDPVER
jgi:predicted RNA-binding protein Jag